MKKLWFGSRYSARKMSFMIGDEIYERYFPHIEVNGNLISIQDKATPTGMMEATDRKTALRMAKDVLRQAKDRRKFWSRITEEAPAHEK